MMKCLKYNLDAWRNMTKCTKTDENDKCVFIFPKTRKKVKMKGFSFLKIRTDTKIREAILVSE